VTGYGQAANASKTQPFKAENIVMISDGYCASTCAIFTELMQQQAGVKMISIGGRVNKSPTQGVGGTKGVNNYPWNTVQNTVQAAVEVSATLDERRKVRQELIGYYYDLPFNRMSGTASLNVRDGLRQNDSSGLALQFKYEPAACRLFYTPEMTVDVTTIWKAAADAQWGNNGKCVKFGYSAPHRRETQTTRLLASHFGNKLSRAHIERLKDTFSIETDPTWQAAGFVQP
jgi:hypothetical protein